MRTIRHTATVLLTSTLLLCSCGPSALEGDGVGETAEEAPQTLTPAALDPLLAAGEHARVVEWISGEADESALEPALARRMIDALWALEEVPRAVRVAKATLARHPGAAPVAVQLATIYSSLDQDGNAVAVLRAAREAGAGDAEIALTLGVCLGRMHDLEGAGAEFERAAAAGASRVDVDYNMAVLLIGSDRHEEAEARLERLLEADPEHLDGRRELARMLLGHHADQDGRLERAQELLNSVLDRRETDWRAFELMGDAAMLGEDYEAAVLYYTEALRHGQNPPHVEGKYVTAAEARNAFLIEEGLIEPEPEPEREGPPIPESLQERWRQARERSADGAEGVEGGGR